MIDFASFVAEALGAGMVFRFVAQAVGAVWAFATAMIRAV